MKPSSVIAPDLRGSGFHHLALLAFFSACTGPNPAFRPRATVSDAAGVRDGGTVSDGGGGQSAEVSRPAGTGGAGDEHGPPGAGGRGGADADADAAAVDTPLADGSGEADASGQVDSNADVAALDAMGAADGLTETPVDLALEVVAPDVPAPASPCPGTAPAGWACVPPGTFTMGSQSSSEPDRGSDENSHQVTLTRPFWMKTSEVSQAEWIALMSNNPSNNSGCVSCPVNQITWYQAIALANAWSRREGLPTCYDRPGGGSYDATAAGNREVPSWIGGLDCRGYRLPTEAEWEYAARAGSRTAFHDGPITQGTDCDPEPALQVAGWYCDNSSDEIHPVRQKKANAWGLFDMHGNVWEWCWDPGTANTAYPSGPAIDPMGDSGTDRRMRGGSYHNNPALCRSANRDAQPPSSTYGDSGVRLARTAL